MRREVVEYDPLAYVPPSGGPSNNDEAIIEDYASPAGVHRVNEIKTEDPVISLTNQFQSLCHTIPLDVTSVASTTTGIQLYARAHAWKHVATLSGKLLSNQGQDLGAGGSLTLVMKLRLESLFRLKMFDELTAEATGIILSEEQRLSTSHEDNSSSTLNCDLILSLKLLVAEVKALMGRYEESMESIYCIQEMLRKHGESPSHHRILHSDFWYWRTRCAVVNAATRQRQWRIALSELFAMYNDITILTGDPVSHHRPRFILLCRIFRAFLQIGDVSTARDIYEQLSKEGTEVGEKLDSDLVDQIDLVHGLLLFSAEQYSEAMKAFSGLIDRDTQKTKTESVSAFSFFDAPRSTEPDAVAPEGEWSFLSCLYVIEESVLPVAVNNFAICALNLKQIKVAVARFEALVQEDPARYLNDAIVFNLCTLYDLTCAPDLGTNKKKVLSNIAGLFHVSDSVNWKSFRLS